MDRDALLETLRKGEVFDLLVVGGGATGCGVALDAASRGLRVALAEKGDFGSGTSGRSTKLVHGGVRYLEAAMLHLDPVQFNLVRDGLHERGVLLRIAPYLCHRIALVTPLYRALEVPYMLAGLKLYDLLSGRMGLGASRFLGPCEVLRRFPMIRGEGLRGGVLYYDGQFNDARMNLALALSAIRLGAAAVNHLEVVQLIKSAGKLSGARVRECAGGESWELRARCVVNASGPWCDGVRRLDDPDAAPLLRVSSGTHIVLPQRFAPAETGITIPKTEDGRVLFILPWLGGCLVGTTDEPALPCEHPVASEADIDYLLRHLKRYFNLAVQRSDVRAAWSGLRPLVQDPGASDTAKLARDHVVSASPSGLVTITGGKWTTYRKMAQDTVDFAVLQAGLDPRSECRTDRIMLAGGEGYLPDAAPALASDFGIPLESARHLERSYGDQAPQVAQLCRGPLAEALAPGHPFLRGELIWAIRREYAVRPLDFLARRIPLALLDSQGAREAAPFVLETMARELGWGEGRVEKERIELRIRLQGPL